jgi:hypothetical protein
VNERIKELKQQALHWSGENVNRNLYSNYEIEQKEYEKFAELIVEECCNRLREETILHDGYGYNQHELYNRLRKHFGVEE